MCGQLSSISEIPVTVTLIVNDDTAQQNSDFTLSVLALNFQPEEEQSCTVISASTDSTLEEDEIFTLELQSSNGLVQVSPTAGVTTITIPNQDSM